MDREILLGHLSAPGQKWPLEEYTWGWDWFGWGQMRRDPYPMLGNGQWILCYIINLLIQPAHIIGCFFHKEEGKREQTLGPTPVHPCEFPQSSLWFLPQCSVIHELRHTLNTTSLTLEASFWVGGSQALSSDQLAKTWGDSQHHRRFHNLWGWLTEPREVLYFIAQFTVKNANGDQPGQGQEGPEYALPVSSGFVTVSVCQCVTTSQGGLCMSWVARVFTEF